MVSYVFIVTNATILVKYIDTELYRCVIMFVKKTHREVWTLQEGRPSWQYTKKSAFADNRARFGQPCTFQYSVNRPKHNY